MSRRLLLLPLLLLLARPAPGQETVDLLLHNGKVFTADAMLSMRTAVAIRGPRIVAVGDETLLRDYRAARVIDLGGRLVIPGFNDTHVHVGGRPRRFVDLAELKSIEEIKRQVRAKARELGPREWVTGGGWAEGAVAEKRNLTRRDLDEAAPENPVVLARAGGHSACGNSLAFQQAGITRSTPDPKGGVIERASDGEPSGIIRERQDLLFRLVPPTSADELRPSFVDALKGLLRQGITSIIQAGVGPLGYAEWQAVYRLHPGELPRAAVQIIPGLGSEGVTADEAIRRLERFGKKTGDGDEWLRVGAVKVWVDGGFAGPAAWTLEPYPSQKDFFGIQNVSEPDLYQLVKAAHAMGWQMGFHTVGDAAIQLAVNVFVRALREAPRVDHRHYLNHFTVLPPRKTLRDMALWNIAVAQQPNFTYAATLESRYVENLTGDKLERNNSLRTPLGHGIFLALGSDNHPIGPMQGLYGAVARQGISGRVYSAAERLSVPEAIVAYTRNGAFLTFEERAKGTIEPGRLADIVVLSRDLLEIEPRAILETSVDLTVLGGKIVHQR